MNKSRVENYWSENHVKASIPDHKKHQTEHIIRVGCCLIPNMENKINVLSVLHAA